MIGNNGFEIRKGWLDPAAQAAMAADSAPWPRPHPSSPR